MLAMREKGCGKKHQRDFEKLARDNLFLRSKPTHPLERKSLEQTFLWRVSATTNEVRSEDLFEPEECLLQRSNHPIFHKP